MEEKPLRKYWKEAYDPRDLARNGGIFSLGKMRVNSKAIWCPNKQIYPETDLFESGSQIQKSAASKDDSRRSSRILGIWAVKIRSHACQSHCKQRRSRLSWWDYIQSVDCAVERLESCHRKSVPLHLKSLSRCNAFWRNRKLSSISSISAWRQGKHRKLPEFHEKTWKSNKTCIQVEWKEALSCTRQSLCPHQCGVKTVGWKILSSEIHSSLFVRI